MVHFESPHPPSLSKESSGWQAMNVSCAGEEGGGHVALPPLLPAPRSGAQADTVATNGEGSEAQCPMARL